MRVPLNKGSTGPCEPSSEPNDRLSAVLLIREIIATPTEGTLEFARALSPHAAAPVETGRDDGTDVDGVCTFLGENVGAYCSQSGSLAAATPRRGTRNSSVTPRVISKFVAKMGKRRIFWVIVAPLQGTVLVKTHAVGPGTSWCPISLPLPLSDTPYTESRSVRTATCVRNNYFNKIIFLCSEFLGTDVASG